MRVFEDLGFGVIVILAVLTFFFVRRGLISRRGGTIVMDLRISTFVPERGWAHGVARFAGDELRWYRTFSLDPRPRRVLSRGSLAVIGRRSPHGAEHYVLPPGCIVIQCAGSDGPVEFALAESALTGLLSWLEAAPPGALRSR